MTRARTPSMRSGKAYCHTHSLVAKQVSALWVMEARRASVVEGVHQEDVTQPADGVEVGPEAPSEPSVALSEGEQPLSSPVVSSADATRWPQ